MSAQPSQSAGTPASPPATRDRRRAERRGRAARARDAFRPAAEVLNTVATNAQRSRLPQMAAALAYRTLFGLIPVLVVALMGLKAFTTSEEIQTYMSQAMRYAGISEIVVRDEADAGIPPEALEYTWLVPVGGSPVPRVLLPQDPETGAPPPDPSKPGSPEGIAVDSTGSARLDEWITGLVTRISTIPITTITTIGLLGLIYAAISMLVEIERSFNQIYRVPVGRSWARRITNYWTLLTLGMILLIATFYVGEKFKGWASLIAQRGGLVAEGAADDALLIRALGFAVTAVISTGLLLLAYTTVPNTRVRVRPAMAGAFIAALLWESGKWGFTQYIGYSANYARLYGSLAILPLFLLWIYVTWLIVLLGLQISYFLQFEQYRIAPVATDAPKVPAVADPALGAAVIAAVARSFRGGGMLTSAAIATAINAHEEAVRAVLGRLVARGLVRQVARTEGPEAYTLGRPADLIPMPDVLEASYELVAPPAGQAADPVLERLRRVQIDGVRGQTVAAMVADDVAAPAAAAGASPAPGPAEGHTNGQPKAGRPVGPPANPQVTVPDPSPAATLPPVG